MEIRLSQQDLENSWKKLDMLSDSFEVSTSTFDLCTPGDCYHSTKRANVQPNHSRTCKVFLSDARASRTKCQTKKEEELLDHVRLHHGIEEQTLQMVHPPCPRRQHHVCGNLPRDHLYLCHHHGRHVHRKACARAHPHHPSCREAERGIAAA